MWHLINNLRLRQSKVKIIFVLIFLTALFFPLHVLANEGSVNMSVQVLPRKITDTINDFDFSSLGTAIQQKTEIPKQVLGVSTTNNASSVKNPSPNFFLGLFVKITGFFKRTF